MREFHCPSCRGQVPFEQCECTSCGNKLLFDTANLKMVRLQDENSRDNREIIGCNWSVEGMGPYCASCCLNRTIPNLSVLRNVLLWKRVEEAKRRLVYDLRRLQLPLVSRNGDHIAFEILSDESGPVLTGHRSGLITLNLAEADDVERESRRIAFREPYRTLLGHFRHEVGHFYWDLLVEGTKLRASFNLIWRVRPKLVACDAVGFCDGLCRFDRSHLADSARAPVR
ncbi:putative zinc-binding metallopeptidase [Bradyrhizobium sp. 190]|uniref:putative zinc-binding metallopeptidase n=1 Tax=Bradyrhizobium sp. 190 TaxID=2782658 RepID=UPI0027E15637|nr:putative zinc-binding metallopeptidase [Bradyrhizobium sp. 190]